jgi:hypothetical protein
MGSEAPGRASIPRRIVSVARARGCLPFLLRANDVSEFSLSKSMTVTGKT